MQRQPHEKLQQPKAPRTFTSAGAFCSSLALVLRVRLRLEEMVIMFETENRRQDRRACERRNLASHLGGKLQGDRRMGERRAGERRVTG